MPFQGSDLRKWFTRVRKRIGGPPGFKRQNGLVFWNGEKEVKHGIGITSFKHSMQDQMNIGFAAWIVVDIDMLSDHWLLQHANVVHDGFIIEVYAGLRDGLGSPSIGSDRVVKISEFNCDQYEELFVQLYLEQIQPYLDDNSTLERTLSKMQTIYPPEVMLPFELLTGDSLSIRRKVGQLLKKNPVAQKDRYVEWLERKNIISSDESKEIKRASIQAIDDCASRMFNIGTRLAK